MTRYGPDMPSFPSELVRRPGSNEYVLMQHPPQDTDPVTTGAIRVMASDSNPGDERPRPRPVEPVEALPVDKPPEVRTSHSLLPESLELMRAIARRLGVSRAVATERAVIDYAAWVAAGGTPLPYAPLRRGPHGDRGRITRNEPCRMSATAFDTLTVLAGCFYRNNRSAAVVSALVWFHDKLNEGVAR